MTERDSSIATQPLPVVTIELGRLIERRVRGEVRGADLTCNHIMALMRVADNPGISRADLARGMQVTPQAVGILTEQLVGKAMISRSSGSPGLPLELSLAEAGYHALKLHRSRIDDVTRDMLRFFRPNLASAVDGALRHILGNLQ